MRWEMRERERKRRYHVQYFQVEFKFIQCFLINLIMTMTICASVLCHLSKANRAPAGLPDGCVCVFVPMFLCCVHVFGIYMLLGLA